jgi:hypothetical protein
MIGVMISKRKQFLKSEEQNGFRYLIPVFQGFSDGLVLTFSTKKNPPGRHLLNSRIEKVEFKTGYQEMPFFKPRSKRS